MNRLLVVPVLFALLISAAAQPAGSSHLQNAVVLFKQGQYEKALAEFKEAHIAQPNNASIDNMIGVTETKLGSLDEANRYYIQAIKLDPQMPAPHKNLAVNYLERRNYDQAERELKSALGLNTRDPFVHYYLATLYLDTARDKEAVEQLEPARELLENDPELLYQMASACLRLNMSAKALSTIRDMEQHSTLSIGQEYKLGLLLSDQKMYPEAVDRFERIVQMQPDFWGSKYDLSIALINANRPAEAVTILQSLSLKRSADPNILTLLGLAYEAAGDSPKALDSYEAAVRAEPENPDRYLDYTRLLMDLDRYDVAAQIVQRGMKDTPDAYGLNVRLGSIQMIQGRYDEARRSFQEAIQTHPEIALGHVALAQSYMRQGRDPEACQVLATSRKIAAPDAMLEYVYGLVLSHLSQPEEAIAAFRRSIALNSELAEPHDELGKLYYQSGLIQPARIEFERVLELDPHQANAHFQLSRIYARLGDSAKSNEMAQKTQLLLRRQREDGLRAQAARMRGFQAKDAPVNR
jgi:tetratricopeptide (TPR) repeat protein